MELSTEQTSKNVMKVVHFVNSPYGTPFIHKSIELHQAGIIDLKAVILSAKNQKKLRIKIINDYINTFKFEKIINITEKEIISVCRENKIKIIFGENINSDKTIRLIKEVKPDLFLVAGFNQIFKSALIRIPGYCINFHGSLLPNYRGPIPTYWTIKNGETITGVTAYLMDEGIDSGPIIKQKTIKINETDTGSYLQERLANIGVQLLENIILNYHNEGFIKVFPQTGEGSYYGKITKKDLQIDLSKSCREIYNQVRASQSWRNCHLVLDGKNIEVSKCEYANELKMNLRHKILSDSVICKASDGFVKLYFDTHES